MSDGPLPSPTATQSTLLARILQEEAATLAQFQAVLDREKEALSGNDAALLEAVIGEKNRLADQLQGFERQKLRVVASTVPAAEEATLRQILAAWQQLPPHAEAWDEICRLARACQTRNQENGAILREKQRFTQEALAVLLDAEKRLDTYDGKGFAQLTLPTRSRTIGSA
ncbi:hypothetical protein JCM16106_03910 [Hydrogenophilus islandicus]